MQTEAFAKALISCLNEYAEYGTIQSQPVKNFSASLNRAVEYFKTNENAISKETQNSFKETADKANQKFIEMSSKESPPVEEKKPPLITKDTLDPNLPRDIQNLFHNQIVKEIRPPSPLHPLTLAKGAIKAVISNYIFSWITREWIPYNPKNTLYGYGIGTLIRYYIWRTAPFTSSCLKPNTDSLRYWDSFLQNAQSVAKNKNTEIGVFAVLKQGENEISVPFSVVSLKDGTFEYRSLGNNTTIQEDLNESIQGLDQSQLISYEMRLFSSIAN